MSFSAGTSAKRHLSSKKPMRLKRLSQLGLTDVGGLLLILLFRCTIIHLFTCIRMHVLAFLLVIWSIL